MNQQNPKCKPYPEMEYPVHSVREPEVEYQTRQNLSFEEDFERAWARRISGDELRQYLYNAIDAFPWKDK
jgi:benzoyl-CoA reductase/2-hydroxyglutaryl-CoA dehydratase subunit BcrC/BadD/HgdB